MKIKMAALITALALLLSACGGGAGASVGSRNGGSLAEIPSAPSGESSAPTPESPAPEEPSQPSSQAASEPASS